MTKVTSHRGFSAFYPENTMLSFKKALETGTDIIELDIHLTKDGELVIIHDENLKRTCGVDKLVKDLTLAELTATNAPGKFKEEHGHTPIPSLKEYFELIKDTDVHTNIEIKSNVFEYEGIEAKLVNLIKEYGLIGRIMVSSFNHHTLLRLKEIAPEIPIAVLTSSWMVEPGRYVKNLGGEYFNPIATYLNKDTVAELDANGIKVNAWTVNTKEDQKKLVDLGVYSIITDRPDILNELLAERK